MDRLQRVRGQDAVGKTPAAATVDNVHRDRRGDVLAHDYGLSPAWIGLTSALLFGGGGGIVLLWWRGGGLSSFVRSGVGCQGRCLGRHGDKREIRASSADTTVRGRQAFDHAELLQSQAGRNARAVSRCAQCTTSKTLGSRLLPPYAVRRRSARGICGLLFFLCCQRLSWLCWTFAASAHA